MRNFNRLTRSNQGKIYLVSRVNNKLLINNYRTLLSLDKKKIFGHSIKTVGESMDGLAVKTMPAARLGIRCSHMSSDPCWSGSREFLFDHITRQTRFSSDLWTYFELTIKAVKSNTSRHQFRIVSYLSKKNELDIYICGSSLLFREHSIWQVSFVTPYFPGK